MALHARPDSLLKLLGLRGGHLAPLLIWHQAHRLHVPWLPVHWVSLFTYLFMG